MEREIAFRLVTAGILVAGLLISVSFRARAEREGEALTRYDDRRLVRRMRIGGLIVILPLLAYLLNPDWVALLRWPAPEWLRWAGAVLAAACLPTFWWVFTTLGRNVSPSAAPRRGATLVTHGPYRWVRHPLYTTGCAAFLGLVCLSALWWLALGLIPLTVFLTRRIPDEEARLIGAFGEDYRGYAARTGRFLPRLGRGTRRAERAPRSV